MAKSGGKKSGGGKGAPNPKGWGGANVKHSK